MRRLLILLAAAGAGVAHSQTNVPAADPARPTLSVPAVLPPTGYLQFEQGINRAVASPSGTAAQTALNQATKIAITPRFLVQVLSQPFTYNRVFTAASGNSPATTLKTEDAGDIDLGTQLVLLPSTGPRPTIDIGYIGRVHTGTAGNLDAGDFQQSFIVYLSGDLPHGFHYDSNYQFNLQRSVDNGSSVSYASARPVRRAQYVQTLSVSHAIFAKSTGGRLGFATELEHYTQPFVTSTAHNAPINVRANAVDLLATVPYTPRPNIVIDFTVLRGVTSTSTEWQGTAGITYLLPRRLWPSRHS